MTNMIKCKICNSEDVKHMFFSKNTHGKNIQSGEEKFDLYECNKCKCIFISKLKVDSEYYKKYYNLGYYGNKKDKSISNFLEKLLFSYSMKRKEKMILDFFKNKTKKLKILDIGCGAGNFLEKLDNKHFDKYGLEINQEGYKLCKNKGVKVINKEINKFDFKQEKFDVVTIWCVLEHINNPIETLKKIKEILTNNGILIFQIPNTGSMGFKFGRQNWFHLDSPRHLVIYNKSSINELCKITGFKIINIKNEFYDYPLDLFWSIRNSKIKYLFYPFYPLIKFSSKELLTIICKKND